jgi:hypothetical protein
VSVFVAAEECVGDFKVVEDLSTRVVREVKGVECQRTAQNEGEGRKEGRKEGRQWLKKGCGMEYTEAVGKYRTLEEETKSESDVMR